MEIIKHSVLYFFLLFNVTSVAAQEAAKNTLQKNVKQENYLVNEKKSRLPKKEIDFYQSDNVTNEIPYFDNRFRIDAELDEITLLFFREQGSLPIILVQPDGKKIRIDNYDPEAVDWHDNTTFDMIKITKPMPGPWQAIGDILPKSKILVVSEVKIETEPFPEILLSGETIKITGKLYNDQRNIKTPAFKDVIQLDVNFFSTNNADYANFSADALKVTSFKDDGRELDEYAGDNIYTGEFFLNFAPGEWQPVLVIALPLMTRELRLKPVILQKSPVAMSITASEKEAIPHNLVLTIDPTYVDPSSLIFQGKITFPDRQVKSFSMMDDEKNIVDPTRRSQDIAYTEPGIHRINISAFGRTITGREFRLVVPEFTFNSKPEVMNPEVITNEKNILDNSAVEAANKIAQLAIEQAEKVALQQEVAKKAQKQKIVIIIAGNLAIILFALGGFLFLRNRKKKH